jgi:hypothetical protein
MEFDPQNLMSDAGIGEVSSFFQPDSSSLSRPSLGTVVGDQEILKDLNTLLGEDDRSVGQSTCGCTSGCGCGNCQCATGKGNESSNLAEDVSRAMENIRSIVGQSRPEFTQALQQIESGLLEALSKPSARARQE